MPSPKVSPSAKVLLLASEDVDGSLVGVVLAEMLVGDASATENTMAVVSGCKCK